MEFFKNYSGVNFFLNTDLSTDHKFPDVKIQILGQFFDPSKLQRPKSSGSVRLASIDPIEPPTIDPNIFGDDFDLQ
ncbi:hypothetical protein B4U80_14378, partial [Leptotrombidium deliense]